MSNQQAKPHPHAERVRAVLKVDFATDNNVARKSGKDTNVPTFFLFSATILLMPVKRRKC